MSEKQNHGVDVDEFFSGADEESGSDVAQSHEEVEEVGEEFTEKATEEAAPEKPNVSITDLIESSDADELEEKEHADGYVPTAAHLKLRKRAQAAEARVKELESQPTRTDAENSGTEIDDDDFVTGKDMKTVAAQIRADAKAEAKAELEADNAKNLVKAKTAKAIADQEVMMAEHPDYLDVIESLSLIGLSPAAKKKIAGSDNAAQAAYEIGCKVLNRKPTQKTTHTNTPSNETKNNNAGQSEEEIFDDIWNS